MKKLTGYELSRRWFEWAWENPDEASANHGVLYLFLCYLWNKLGQPESFKISSTEASRGMGNVSYNTYKKSFDFLIINRFITLIKKSENQYQCNVIALSKSDKPLDGSLHKALSSDSSKSDKPLDKPVDKPLETFLNKGINKLLNNNNEEEKKTPPSPLDLKNIENLKIEFLADEIWQEQAALSLGIEKKDIPARLEAFHRHLIVSKDLVKTFNDYAKHFVNYTRKKINSNGNSNQRGDSFNKGIAAPAGSGRFTKK